MRQQGEAIERAQAMLAEMLRIVQVLARAADLDEYGHTAEQQAKLRQVAANIRKDMGFDD